MADVTGPISTLPGATHALPKGATCDQHPDRPAVVRVQGETDSFGCEMIDMCEECRQADLEEQRNADTSGVCEWCKQHAPRLRHRRDYEEGHVGSRLRGLRRLHQARERGRRAIPARLRFGRLGRMSMMPTGDKGQRYEVSALGYPFPGELCVIGWSESKDDADKMAEAIRKAPGCNSAVVRDRWETDDQRFERARKTPVLLLSEADIALLDIGGQEFARRAKDRHRREATCPGHERESTGSLDQARRGWHPAKCKHCGMDMSIDSGD